MIDNLLGPDSPLYVSDENPEQSIPLPTADEEFAMSTSDVPDALPILALRNTVLFPGVVLPITVGRDTSLRLVKDAFNDEGLIGVVAQRSSDVENPTADELYEVGTVASILKLIKMPDGSKSIVIQGKRRFRTVEFVQEDPYFVAKVAPMAEEPAAEDDIQLQAHIRSIKDLAVQIVNMSPNLPSEAAYAIQNIESPAFLIHFIASNLQVDVEEKQALLETLPIVERADLVLNLLNRELQVLRLSEEIRSRVKTDVDQQQREYLLRQQMKAIQEELGEGEFGGAEVHELRERAEEKELPEHVRKALDKELDKLGRTNPAAPDYAVTRNYVDWILDLPWREYSDDHLDLKRSEEILDEDHFGLEQVKKRILEHLAVLKLKGDMKAPILCFYGPPGVGKTSLGKSIARAMGRQFVRMSLGGVRDEAEIRGHRRTYVGALPGRVVQGMKKAGKANPVFMLDEVDKLGADFRGDPSSALLEVLDPEQNNAFNDHYLELDYDLSKVLFIATANYLEMIPAPLRDRMEMIEINGYTQDEKLQIAKQYLVPRQIERNGLKQDQISITDDALMLLVDGYTRESGVRQLERMIGSVARGVAKKIALGESEAEAVDAGEIEDLVGSRKHFSEVAERTEVPGVATGLAWTPVGGDILFIESSVSRGNGRLILTGQLGDVMKESAQAAFSYVRAHAERLGIPNDAFRYWDLHVHVPAGAVPKDGPSAGVAMLSSLISIYTQRRVKHTVAMTGEITLRGLVLPVGGIKEKVLAARRAGIETVLLPERNEKDVKEIKSEALEGVTIHYVKRMDDVTTWALEAEATTDPALLFRIPDAEKNQESVRPPSPTLAEGTVVN
ncbi:MAG: endopeptidase La [Rhodothermales bacterium]